MDSAVNRAIDSATPWFDPFEPRGDEPDGPYPIYRRLRNDAPVYFNSSRGFWALSRFDDVRAASRDWETFSNAGGVDLDELGQRVFGPGDFLDMDPPEHDELRAIVKSCFTPKAVNALQPLIQAHVDELVADTAVRDTVDAVEALALPLPLHVMCSLFGFDGDRSELTKLYGRVMRRSASEVAIPSSALEAAAVMRSYFLEQARECRKRPRDDLMTQIALGELDGERLPERKALGMCFVIFSAGIDTVCSVLASALLHLAQHPSQRRVVLDDPFSLPAAIEEVLRYDSPLQFNARTTTREVVISRDVLPAGERVLLLYGSANRDERRFEDPDRFDVTREAKRHLAFGEGIHFCIGAPLARLEAGIALREVLSRMPDYQVMGSVERLPLYNMRSLARLPISTR